MKKVAILLIISSLFSCQRPKIAPPFIDDKCSFKSEVKRPQYFVSSDSQFVRSPDSIVLSNTINLCYSLDTVSTKINNKDYFLMFLGIQKCDSFGYIRREVDKIFYLHPDFSLYNSDDPRSKEQLFLDFSKDDQENIFTTSFMGDRTRLHLFNKSYSSSLNDSIYHYAVDSTITAVSMHGYNMEKLIIGKRTGLQNIIISDYDEESHMQQRVTFSKQCK